MNIYLACALTCVPRNHFKQYVSFIHRVAESLRSSDCEVKYALVNSDPQLAEKPFRQRARLCYLWDTQLVRQAEVVIAEASNPSTGLGIELQIAASLGTPIIISFKKAAEARMGAVKYKNPNHRQHSLQIGEGYVSLMALGLPSVFKVVGYRTESEGMTSITQAVRLLKRKP